MMTLHMLLLLGGFGALYFGAEWLVRGSARIATNMGVSPVVVGLTLVSLGTSAPELVVSIVATLEGRGSLLASNVLGSNLANIGLILGITAVISPLAVANRVISREVPIMIVVTIAVFPVMLVDDPPGLTRFGGLVLLGLLAAYVAFTFMSADDEIQEIVDEVGELADTAEEGPGNLRNLLLVVLGAGGLAAGGKAIVEGASYVGVQFGLSEMVVGATIVAVGTSLPELVTSVVAAVRKEADIAVGNVVGSNIFNLTAVLGASAVVRGYVIDPEIMKEWLMVLLLSVVMWPVVTTAREVRRGEGVLLLAAYVAFLGIIALGK